MREEILKINSGPKKYRFRYNNTARNVWPAKGVVGTWYDNGTQRWLPILALQVKQRLYNQFFKGGAQ